ncbi:glycosyltransferase [Geomesophilobacter sediminis]|uniref:Glycosyltransferase n=1 Tax=Geomesophilobacter sediminis TaxID=2798584 RepID=A0A8J7SBR6_9BACT|nr:glycosyltransferase [Geomesophilobacter sediminis]MBJ6726509.1 glycosyltransferase [Geomesophilobacter sediminis]
MSSEPSFDLSVVVPVLDEREQIAPLFESLRRQIEVRIEVILSDGGSSDGTVELARTLAAPAALPLTVVTGTRGRGAQMNRGAAASRSPHVLFLHADSRFTDPRALRSALDRLAAAETRHCDTPVAGRFSLIFAFDRTPPLPYRFYQYKARLDRPGCTHGDQGFLLSRHAFERLGPFPETFMEDNVFAERVREQGAWLLFPSEILTSPRRFLVEGLRPRQTLNAVLMNLYWIGRLDLLGDLERTYRRHGSTERLDLSAFLPALRERIERLPTGERSRFWQETGSYVRSQAWQLAFLTDVVLGQEKKGICLTLHDGIFDRLTDNALGRRIATLLTKCWFRMVAG